MVSSEAVPRLYWMLTSGFPYVMSSQSPCEVGAAPVLTLQIRKLKQNLNRPRPQMRELGLEPRGQLWHEWSTFLSGSGSVLALGHSEMS